MRRRSGEDGEGGWMEQCVAYSLMLWIKALPVLPVQNEITLTERRLPKLFIATSSLHFGVSLVLFTNIGY